MNDSNVNTVCKHPVFRLDSTWNTTYSKLGVESFKMDQKD